MPLFPKVVGHENSMTSQLRHIFFDTLIIFQAALLQLKHLTFAQPMSIIMQIKLLHVFWGKLRGVASSKWWGRSRAKLGEGRLGAQISTKKLFFSQILARKLLSCKMNISSCGLGESRRFANEGEGAIGLEPPIEGLVPKIMKKLETGAKFSRDGVKIRSAH